KARTNVVVLGFVLVGAVPLKVDAHTTWGVLAMDPTVGDRDLLVVCCASNQQSPIAANPAALRTRSQCKPVEHELMPSNATRSAIVDLNGLRKVAGAYVRWSLWVDPQPLNATVHRAIDVK